MCFCRAFWSLVLLILIGMPYLSIDFHLISSSPCHTIPHSLRASWICLKLNVESFRTSELLHKATIPNHRGMLEGTISSISSAFELSWSFISPKCGLFASENQIFSLPFDVVSWARILCIALTSSVWLTTTISQTLHSPNPTQNDNSRYLNLQHTQYEEFEWANSSEYLFGTKEEFMKAVGEWGIEWDINLTSFQIQQQQVAFEICEAQLPGSLALRDIQQAIDSNPLIIWKMERIEGQLKISPLRSSDGVNHAITNQIRV